MTAPAAPTRLSLAERADALEALLRDLDAQGPCSCDEALALRDAVIEVIAELRDSSRRICAFADLMDRFTSVEVVLEREGLPAVGWPEGVEA